MQNIKNKGFTLVELAITLVIIGLLVAGILQGQELVKQARIINLVSTVRGFDLALNTFRAKYDNALPGDFSKACNFGLCVTPGTTTINISMQSSVMGSDYDGTGNDNFILECAQSDNSSSYDCFSGEPANFWVHLSNARLIKGNFSQIGEIYGNTSAKIAYPSLPFKSGAVAYTDIRRKNELYYIVGTAEDIGNAAPRANTPGFPEAKLNPEIAHAIDFKMDDGAPRAGSVQTISGYSTGNADLGSFSAANVGTDEDDCNTATEYNYLNKNAPCLLKAKAAN